MPTIYQKYRPQTFADLIGQNHIIETIKNEVANDKITHAYLFYGPRGIGKTSLARIFAKSLNCEKRKNGDYEPCNECTSCQEITSGRHIDVIEMDAASHTGVDNVRENIIENSQFRPTKAKYKIFVIDEVHMLSKSAFNALLKTLEEPPQNTIFILATTELHKVIETIVSRCQRFHFGKIAFKEMNQALKAVCKREEIEVEKEVIERVINKSDGCLRDAQSLLGQILSIDKKKITLEDAEIVLPSSNVESLLQFIDNIIDKNVKENYDLIQELIDNGVNLDQFCYDLLEVMRLLLILQTDPTKNIAIDYSSNDAKKIKKMSQDTDSRQLVTMIESLMLRKVQIKTAPLPQLPLELFIVEFGQNSDSHSDAASGISESHEILKQVQDDREDSACLPVISDEKNENAKSSSDSNTDSQNDTENAPPIKKETKLAKIKEKITSIGKSQPLKTKLDQIKTKWAKLVDQLSSKNHSLGFILKMCSVKGLDQKNGKLLLGVPYGIHKDKLDESHIKQLIEDEIETEFNEHIIIKCDICKEEIKKEVPKDIQDLATDFGGEIVV